MKVSQWGMREPGGGREGHKDLQGHSGEYGNVAKLVGKMSKSVIQLISIHF